MNKQQTLSKIEREWNAFLSIIEGLSDEALSEPNTLGEWSVRDLLAHIATWDEEAVKALPVILDGKSPPKYTRYGGINAFNEQEQERKRPLSLSQVKQEMRDAHQQLVKFLESVPDDVFLTNPRFQRRLRYDTHRHYPQHAADVAAYRRARGF